MKIEAASSSTAGDVVPPMIASLIERIKTAVTTEQFIEEINNARSIQTILAKTELYRWAEVLNRCDDLLADAATVEDGRMKVDSIASVKTATVSILRFTALLFECSSTRRVFSSTDRLISLLDSEDLDIIAEVLRLLQTMSKRSKFLPTRLCPTEQSVLVQCLTSIAQCWGGRLRNVKMTDCVLAGTKITVFPFSYQDGHGHTANLAEPPVNKPLLPVVDEICEGMSRDHRYCVLARLRMLRYFDSQEHRMKCLIVRLLAISTLIHCRCQPEESQSQINALLYAGFIEETAALLKNELEEHPLIDPIRTEALRTLTSIVSLEKSAKVVQILESLGASSYHGYLAVFTRLVVDDLKNSRLGSAGKPSVALGTALFSFIYHLSSVEPGGETLVACGLTQTLLSVLEYKELALDQISFATRCSRIIDIFTTLDTVVFNSSSGMTIFVDRLVYEVNECRKEQPFVIDVAGDVDDETFKGQPVKCSPLEKRCHQHRSGLIKGLLTFIKRAIQETNLQESVRHLMDGELPDALMHIISNAEFYSDSIYHHSLQLITNFIYQEPTQLTMLQQKHVPYVMLQSMLRKELPNSRDVISNLANVFTALCLNEKGLRQFKAYLPFDHVFKVVLSIKFIATMKKKRSEMNDSAQGIGSALDDLLRHQPTLKPHMLDAVVKVLDMLLDIGQNPPANTKIVMALSRSASKAACQNFGSGANSPDAGPAEEEQAFSPHRAQGDEDMSDDEDEELSMDEMTSMGEPAVDKMGLEMDCPSDPNDGTRTLPLGDYLLIFTKIFETIITQVSAGDMVEGFVAKDGVEKLIALSQLPNLSTELASSYFCQSIATIVQYILQHSRAADRLMTSMLTIFDERADALVQSAPAEGGSLMIHLGKSKLEEALACIGAAIPIFCHLSKPMFTGGQYSADRRTRVHDAWLTESGKKLHSKLRKVSRCLSWESTLIKLIEPMKVAVSTQTDGLTSGELADIETSMREGTNVAGVVAVTGTQIRPAWEEAGLTSDELLFWQEQKELGDTVGKCNRTLIELLNLLARSCYIPTRRSRRYDYSGTIMSKSAVKMADHIFAGVYRDLKWASPKAVDTPMEFGRLHDVITQLTGVLFDERKMSYHAMLERFYTSGCHQAFCEILSNRLAPALDGPSSVPLELAFGEWFRLAGRLANRHSLTYSMYRQNQAQSQAFDPEKYSKLVKNDFFRCLSVLFARLSGEGVDLRNYQSLCESAISVYKEVAQCIETPEEPAATGNSSARSATSFPPDIDILRRVLPEDHIRQMIDMGFNREDVVQALMENQNANDAAEYLIGRHHILHGGNPGEAGANVLAALQNHMEMDEGAAMRQANAESETSSEGRASAGLEDVVADDDVSAPIITPLKELTIEDNVSMSKACIELMPLCKRLMEVGSDLVFSCADLVIGVVDSLDEQWKLHELIKKIMLEEIIEMARGIMNEKTPTNEKSVSLLATRIHFVCLLFEHLSDDYLRMVAEHPMVSTMLLLLGTVHAQFDLSFMHSTLLPPVVLWLDLYDKCSRSIKRRLLLEKLVPSKQLLWSYQEEEPRYTAAPRSGRKWTPYSPQTQIQVNSMFFRGKPFAAMKKRDKEVVIDFASMQQKENDVVTCNVNAEIPDELTVDLKSIETSENESVWTEAERSEVLVQICRLLQKGMVHHTAAHSILSFTARLTKDTTTANNFLQQGGVVAILQLCSSNTPWTESLVSLILRQCIDSDELSTGIIDKAVRATASLNATPLTEYLGISDTKPKEWVEVLKKLTPLSVRNPEIFISNMDKSTKLTSNGQNIQYVGKIGRPVLDVNSNMEQIVHLMWNEVIHGEWQKDENASMVHSRMMSRGSILTLLAELVKTYGGIAGLICDAKDTGRGVVQILMEKYLGGKDKETLKSLKVLVSILAGCNNSPKAQEGLVNDVKAVLQSIGAEATEAPKPVYSKIVELCSLMVMMVDSCPAPMPPPGQRNLPANAIVKLFHKKKICNDLVKTVTLFKLTDKESVDVINHVLKTVETLVRNINTPAVTAPTTAQANSDRIPLSTMRGLIPDLMDFDDEDAAHHSRFLDGAERLLRAHLPAGVRVARDADEADDDEAERFEQHEHQVAVDENEARVRIVDEDDDEDGEDEEDSQGSSSDDDDDDEDDDEIVDGVDGEEAEQAEADAINEMQQMEEAEQGGSVGDGNNDETMEMGEQEGDDHHEEEEGDTEDEEDEAEEEYDYPYEDDAAPGGVEGMYRDLEPANMIMDGLVDEWDLFPPFGGLRGEPRRARPVPNEAHHPLMVRPQHIADTAPVHHPSHLSNSAAMRDYRFVLGASSGGLSLTRQNAIRRMGAVSGRLRPPGPAGSHIFDRLFDMQIRDRSGTLVNLVQGPSYGRADDRHLRAPVTVPSALDRLTEGAELLEPLSIRFVALLIHTIVTKTAKEKLEEENKKEKEKEDARAAAAAAVTSVNATATPATPSAEGAGESSDSTAAATSDPPQAEVAEPTAPEAAPISVEPTQEDERMDTSEIVVAAPADTIDESSMDDVQAHSSAATAASSEQGADESPSPMGDDIADETEAAEQAAPTPVDTPATPLEEPTSQEIPEEYRAILGDIAIPAGVDPAFLAALPDDMRAEVIRDHERQQRAQRVTVAAASVAAAAPTGEEGGAATGAVPAAAIVEPIDQEFLAALPPELQEEIIQQHERAVREAEEAVRRANAPAAPADPIMDGAAVIASLPTTERQQVLAEMDDAELQRLPAAMQDEARRARTNLQNIFEPHMQRNVMRIHNMYARGGPGGTSGRLVPRAAGGPRPATSAVGNMAGKTVTASVQAVPLLDRESILTLCTLYLVDGRLSVTRLHKVIRLVCSHPASCDYVIWCLQSLFEKSSQAGSAVDEEEIVDVCPPWLASITVPGGGHNERTLKINKGGEKVSIHPLAGIAVSRSIVDSLITLAKSYPGHFIPPCLRNEPLPADLKRIPSRDLFWQLMLNPTEKQSGFGKDGAPENRTPLVQLKDSPVVNFMQLFKNSVIKRTSLLQDKLLRLVNSVVQTLPNDTMARLALNETEVPLEEELMSIITILTGGMVGQDGFLDGRTLLVEAMRAFSPATTDLVYDILCESAKKIGLKLQPQIDVLMTELGEVAVNPAAPSTSAGGKGRITSARLAGDAVVVDGEAMGRLRMTASSCRELRLPAVMALTDRSGAQTNLLTTLQLLTKIRDTMRHMKDERKRRRLDEEKKKAEEAEKERKEKEAKEAADAAGAAGAAAATEQPAADAQESATVPMEGSAETGPAPAPEQPTEAPAATSSTTVTVPPPEENSDSAEAASSSELPKETAPTDPLEVLRSIEDPSFRLSDRLSGLTDLWDVVSKCLLRLGKASDSHAVLALQPAAEAFFLVHAVPKGTSPPDHEHPDTVRMIEFAEKHREVLNQVLRQNNQALSPGGPFAILTQFPKLLDFDVKRKYFRKELTKMDNDRDRYRRADVNVQVRRSQLFSDSFRELFRLRPSEWKKRFYIVFQGEEGQDAGGLLREWFSVITREIFNPNYALFITAPGDMVTYMINKASYINPEHLDYFKFVGRLIAKAIYDNKLLDCYFTRAFYKHILNLPVRYQDIESEDPAFFKSLEFLLNNPINDLGLDLTFSLEVEEFGVRSIRDLKTDGRKIDVTDENKTEYVNLVCQMKMTGSIRKQLDAFLTGFYEVIPRQLISMFNEQELELLISGLPDVDIDDLANHTEYKSYTKTSPQIQWFWRALRSFEPEDRAKFLQFVTGTSKVPLQGFGSLEGMNGVQKFSIHMDTRGGDRLPAAHTCFNQLDLPQYDSYENLRDRLQVAIRECTEGFGFA